MGVDCSLFAKVKGKENEYESIYLDREYNFYGFDIDFTFMNDNWETDIPSAINQIDLVLKRLGKYDGEKNHRLNALKLKILMNMYKWSKITISNDSGGTVEDELLFYNKDLYTVKRLEDLF